MTEGNMIHRGQFLLSRSAVSSLPSWKLIQFGAYQLYCHPELPFSESKTDKNKCVVLGDVYSWNMPELANPDISDILVKANSKEELIEMSSDFCGDYVILFELENETLVMNDACAQSEVFYSENFSSFASQINLLAKAEKLSENATKEITDYYKSKEFRKTQLHIGDKTEYENVRHLRPNHYLSLATKKAVRFFPARRSEVLTVKQSAIKACQMLKGFMKAISLRHELALGVTAGIDSRVLFLASLNLDVRYYTSQFDFMNSDHYDITVAKKLTGIFHKELEIIPEVSAENFEQADYKKAKADFEESVDHPRIWYFNKIFNSNKSLANTMSINGNISEIARNYFGYSKSVNGSTLQGLAGLQPIGLARIEYETWVKELEEIDHDFNLLDLFYWEERMGNWAAKAKTESKAHGRGVVSPFNSRNLLITLLSTHRKHRDSHLSKLYTEMVKVLSDNHSEVMKLPINPSKKQFVIKTLKRLKVYNAYQKVRLAIFK